MEEPKIVDLSLSKTEHEAVPRLDRFWLAVVPKLFEWLRWTIMLSAIGYVGQKSNSLLLKLIVDLCYLALFFYYQSFFFQFEFINLPLIKSRVARIASFSLSLALGLITYGLVRFTVDVLINIHP